MSRCGGDDPSAAPKYAVFGAMIASSLRYAAAHCMHAHEAASCQVLSTPKTSIAARSSRNQRSKRNHPLARGALEAAFAEL